jgi:hypothetical protein
VATRVFKIPLTNIPQRFAIDLAGKSYIVVSRYNAEMGSWLLSMQDGDTEAEIFNSLPLVAGVDLLAQYGYLGIPGSLIVYTDGNEFSPPDEFNLGVESNLYYVVEQ